MRKRKLQQLNLVATKWGMPMRGGPRSIIKLERTGSDRVSVRLVATRKERRDGEREAAESPHNAATADVTSARAMAAA
jgi:hypothetical protein